MLKNDVMLFKSNSTNCFLCNEGYSDVSLGEKIEQELTKEHVTCIWLFADTTNSSCITMVKNAMKSSVDGERRNILDTHVCY